MIQDINPHRLYNQYDPEKRPSDDSRIFAFRDSAQNKRDIELLVKIRDEGKTLDIPKRSDFAEELSEASFIYLFSVDDESFFLLDKKESAIAEKTEENADYSFVSFTELRNAGLQPKEYVYAAFTAYQLAEWYSVTRYCGKCGAENENDKKERARTCPKCGNKIYPRINPAVIIGITDKETDSIVLTKYRVGYGHNALVAGFTEIGETLEECVAREVMEEVGLTVTNIRYYKSQPWGIASDILVGFYCDVVGDKTIKMDKGELKYAEWVKRPDIILQPLEYSLTNEMMQTFKNNGYSGTL
ncbi:NAD(+) diphosphatase [Butyrivibrio sp. XB500-5]|uniref:NAD(+) diphosphatase n=1 Tax=Butyrivibrio sp. XB500-5 TaxID=2364880 RepID=UPI000EA8669D|nr:NAD(+) diphosphatase [Butyrivibrio sp. XB500-5]RKM60827.1 NAD(+) diphosphatase [Butyrivibrio sp. XB500-5]